MARPLHPLIGAAAVALGGLGLSALPLLRWSPALPLEWPAPLQVLPASALAGAALSLLAALITGLGLLGARRRAARIEIERQAAVEAQEAEQERLQRHLAELGEKAQREAEFAALTEAGLRQDSEGLHRRLACIDAALQRFELDADGRLLEAAAGLQPGESLQLGAGAREALHSGQAWCGPLQLPDGEVLLLRLQPLEAGRFIGLGLPQTQLWRQRAELQQAYGRQREWLDGQQAGGWRWKRIEGGGERLRLDRRALALLGLPAAGSVEMDAAQLSDRIHPDDRARWQAAFARLLAGRDALLHQELRLRRGDGAAAAWTWLCLRGSVSGRDAQGQALRLAGTLFDIERPRTEAWRSASLQQVDDWLPQALGAAGFCWLPDEDRWIWTPAAAALLQRVELPAELTLQQALQAVAPAQREAVEGLLRGLAADGGEATLDALRLQGDLGAQRQLRLQARRACGENPSEAEGRQVIGLLVSAERELERSQLLARLEVLEAALQSPVAEPPLHLDAARLQQALAAGVDLQRGLARFQGRSDLYLRATRSFTAMAQALPQQLQADLDAGRRDAAQRALHGFKGLAATLACERLAQWGAAGEQRLRGAQGLDAEWLQAFELQLNEGLALLRRLSERPVDGGPPASGRPEALQRLDQALQAADPGLADWLVAQREQLLPWLGEADLAALRERVAVADHAGARQLLAGSGLSRAA